MSFFRTNLSISSHCNILLVVLFLNVLIVAYFWSVLGKNYTPVNDAWVSVSTFDQISSHNHNQEVPQKIGARVVRTIPFRLASHLEEVGFITLNTFLVLVNILTGFGIFLVLNRIFPGKILLSVVSSLLIMYFPYDGTMFWLGAFGVNLGYLLSIYALYFFICSVEDSSKAKFLFALLMLLASGRTYPGYLPVQALFLFLYLFLKRKSWRIWWTKAGLFFFTWAVGFVQFADNAISGHGREGNVADFVLTEVLNGFSHANRHLFIEAWSTLLEPNSGLWGRGLVVSLVASVAFYWIYRLVADSGAINNDSSKSYKKIVLWLVVVAPLIVVAGYAPYALSDIRFGTDRQLLFARPGVVLLYTATQFWFIFSMVRSPKIANMTIIVLSAVIIGLSVQAKSKLAAEYAEASRMERIFLGDLAETVPKISGHPIILIHFDKSVIVNSKAKMMLNRLQFPIGYLFGDYDITVFGANDFLLRRYLRTYRDGALCIKGLQVPIENLLAFAYDLENGLRILNNLKVPVEGNKEKVVQLSSPWIMDNPLTKRQRWFVNERDRLVQLSGLRVSAFP